MFFNWSLNPIFNSYLAVLLLVAGLLLMLALRPTFRNLSPSKHVVLNLLRAFVVLLLLIAMIRPTFTRRSTETQTAVLIVLLDKSRSMTLPNANDSSSRWEAQQQTLVAAADAFRELGKEIEVRCYAYDSQLFPLDFDDGKIGFPSAPDGTQTDLGSNIYESIVRERTNLLAGVVLLGDGTQTAFDPSVEVMEAGRELARLDYPLFAIPFGPAADVSQARDLVMQNVPEQYTVFVKNKLTVRGRLRAVGYANRELPVDLLVEDSQGKQTVVATEMFPSGTASDPIEIQVDYTPQTAGQFKLILRAQEQPGELVTKNNQLQSYLTVLAGGLRVVQLTGELRKESAAIRRSIAASPDIQLEHLNIDHYEQQDAGRIPQASDETVDVFMIGDLDSQSLGKQNIDAIRDQVARGKGLIMLGGFHSFGPGGYRNTSLEEVLPVVIGRFERQDFGAPDRRDVHLFDNPDDPTDMRIIPARPHPTTLLAQRDRNAQLWAELPELEGVNRFSGLKETPGTFVLLQNKAQVPILVSGEYVQGRVLACASDSTWRWVLRGYAREHRRFWRQVILWLAKRDDLQQKDLWVQLPQRRYNPGSRVTFTTGVKSELGEAVAGAQLSAQITSPEGTTQTVALSQMEENFRGSLDRVIQPGEYKLEVSGELDGTPLEATELAFQVLDQDIELSNPVADPDQLIQLARLTADSGGSALAPEELPALLRRLAKDPPKIDIQVQQRWQFADTWWDAWLFFLAVVSLLTIEWSLRKAWGLV